MEHVPRPAILSRFRDPVVVLADALCQVRSVSHIETTRGLATKNIYVEHNKKWCAQGDDFRTFLADFVANVPQFDLSAALSL